MDGVRQSRRHAIDKGGQDQSAEVRSPPLFRVIQFFLIEGIRAVITVGNKLVAVGPGLVVALQPLEHLKRLLGAGNRLVDDLGRVFFKLRGIKPAKLLAAK